MNLSIIIPVYNESESILHFIEELSGLYRNSSDTEIIFVNDGSTDDTLSILKASMNNLPNSRIINLYRNYGKSIALQAGFDVAKGSIIAMIDGDLQDNPKEIKGLVNHLNKGYDLVSGWKKNRKDPFVKKIASSIFNIN